MLCCFNFIVVVIAYKFSFYKMYEYKQFLLFNFMNWLLIYHAGEDHFFFDLSISSRFVGEVANRFLTKLNMLYM